MSFDNYYPKRKDWRKPYIYEHKNTKAKNCSQACRNNGSDPWATQGRLYNYKKRAEQADNKLNDYLKGIE